MNTTSPYTVTTVATLVGVNSLVVTSTYVYAVSVDSYAIYRSLLSSCTGSSFVMSSIFAGSSSSQGYSDGTLTSATFYGFGSITMDATGNLYVVDGDSVRYVSSSSVSTISGSSSSGDITGSGKVARFNGPGFVVIVNNSTLILSDSNNNKLKKISCGSGLYLYQGMCVTSPTRFPTYTPSLKPSSIPTFAPTVSYISNINVTLIAGNGTSYMANGIGSSAKFSNPCCICVDYSFTFAYVGDSGNYYNTLMCF